LPVFGVSAETGTFSKETYGKAYLAFFEFVRWLFGFNALLCVLTLVFIVAPQYAYQSTATTFTPSQIALLGECSLITNSTIVTTDEAVKTECCSRDYVAYVNNTILSNSKETVIFDVLQGTVCLSLCSSPPTQTESIILC
jgi:hypothetical protein